MKGYNLMSINFHAHAMVHILFLFLVQSTTTTVQEYHLNSKFSCLAKIQGCYKSWHELSNSKKTIM